ncbi:MFS transporter [Amycolatopsis pigmentata]|uniref:MFS transporter n=1 Tax=Amycolatopsis pigmentata TaxID=450801 RepID=A0ABW5G3V8_9PSEU
MSANTESEPVNSESDSATASGRTYKQRRRRAIASAWAGFAIDSFSIYVVSTALLPAMGYFQAKLSAEQLSIFVGMTLGATLLGRPLGALIFGHFADTIGRRRVGSITIYGFGTVSFLMACLPGAEAIGATLATSLLIGLRFVEGIFLGGEYTAATPMALEYAPPKRRGLIGAMIQCSASFGPFVVAILVTLVLTFAPNAGLHSPYVQWGWRIPFIIGGVLAFIVAFYLRRQVEDSNIFKETARSKAPLRQMLKGKSGRAFIQSYFMMTGIFFASNMLGSVMPQFLLKNKGYTASDLAHTQLITAWPAVASYLLYGFLSDKIGRKRALYIAAGVTIVVSPITLYLIGSGNVHGWLNLTLLGCLTGFAIVGSFGVLPAYINERFSTAVRSSGWGVAYSTAVIVPSFFAYYQVWLGHIMPFAWTAGVMTALGGLFILFASMSGPETHGLDMHALEKVVGAES